MLILNLIKTNVNWNPTTATQWWKLKKNTSKLLKINSEVSKEVTPCKTA